MNEAPSARDETLRPPSERGADVLSLREITVERGRRAVVRDVSIEIPSA